MTVLNRVKRNEQITILKKYLAYGQISLMEAARRVYDLYMQGYLTFDESEEAIRQLAKVKVGQKI